MRHDVVRQAGEHETTRHVVARLVFSCREVTEEQRDLGRRVIRTLARAARVGRSAGAARTPSRSSDRCLAEAVRAATGQRRPNASSKLRIVRLRDGVHHLLVELRRPLTRRETILCEERRILQVDRLVEASAAGSTSITSRYSPIGPDCSGSHGTSNRTSLMGARSTAVVKLGFDSRIRASADRPAAAAQRAVRT